MMHRQQGFIPLEAEYPVACRGDECSANCLANTGLNTQRKLLTGFILMEVIVALSIFVIASVIVADIFVRSTQAGRTIVARARMLRETRTGFEDLVRLIRFGTIDYDYYAPPPPLPATLSVPLTELAIRDAKNRRTVIRASEGASCPPDTSSCLVLDRNAMTASITPQGVRLSSVAFFVSPIQDPFRKNGDVYLANDQPRVTILMTLVLPSSRGEEEMVLRTTVSSRAYKR